MAHYVAELIKGTEQNISKNQEKCFETILAMWQQMHVLPDGKRPFQALEPVLRALESLDPIDSQPRYYPTARPPAEETEASATSRKMLELADSLDYTARILIRQCLTNAAASAIDKSREWVNLAERVGRNDIELPIVRIIIGERDLNATSDPNNEQRKLLEDRVSKLRAFIGLATVVAADYERQLERNKSKPETKTSSKSSARSLATAIARPQRLIVQTHSKPERINSKKAKPVRLRRRRSQSVRRK